MFTRTRLVPSISIDKLISFHYFEYASGYIFEGEHHDFWELVYVDKGQVEVQADERIIELTQGDMIFHQPDEFHTVRVRPHHKPPNLVVISFDCASSDMDHFHGKICKLSDQEQHYLSQALHEGFQAFVPPYDNPTDHTLTARPDAPFAAVQCLRMWLEMLLISLVRSFQQPDADRQPSKLQAANRANFEQALTDKIVRYLQDNLSVQLTLEQVCGHFHMGRSRLREIFHARYQTGIMEYYKQLKFEEAKSLIREQQYNFTEIAAKLGYASIHYFSREFKKQAGMSPSEYARSVKARAQRNMRG